ncbi:HamA C-terminal domain-containing protein [Paraburkholderia graminis]|uniref:HamA C-terminal domain-containing protein n=1 Tax=Paraburkholderia graminis TaxID=60548 RepID=UPI0038B75F7B
MTKARNRFAALLDPIHGVDNVLKEVTATPALEQPRLLFVRMQEHVPRVDALAELLVDQLVNYVIPLRKRREAFAQSNNSATGGDMSVVSRLRREAKRLLVTYNQKHPGRYGEVGELIAYVVAVRYLGAAQLGAKMALKTSSEMPVHGVDGLHGSQADDGSVLFYLLESKLIPSATDASREMVHSIAEHQADRGRMLNELRLVSDLSNLDSLEGEAREAAKSFFNSYTGDGSHLRRRDIHVGSLVFSESAFEKKLPRDLKKPPEIHEQHLEKLYAAKHKTFAKNLKNQADAKGVDLGGCIVFLIAIPDVNEFKRIFAEFNS